MTVTEVSPHENVKATTGPVVRYKPNPLGPIKPPSSHNKYDLWTTPVIHMDNSWLLPENNTPIESTSSKSSFPEFDEVDCDGVETQLVDIPLPSMENIFPHKRLNLPPSCFAGGCVCGHQFEHRDVYYERRKLKLLRSPGITIRPKCAPVNIKLRS